MFIDKQYVATVLERIEFLLKKKKSYLVDLHIHTNHSTDGRQSVSEAISRARQLGFDIISITDHDSIEAYSEINDLDLFEFPIIIPGVEFTVSYPLYGERCHILKYFFNEFDDEIKNALKQNKASGWSRAKLHFEQISYNRCLQSFFEEYDIVCSLDNYIDFLVDNCQCPDYASLVDYIFFLLNVKAIGVWDVYLRMCEINEIDPCDARRLHKSYALKKFHDKYKDQRSQLNSRRLLPLLATVTVVDSNYPDYVSSGNLTILNYGQVDINQIKKSGFNIFAHPNANKLNLVDNIPDIIAGFELNYRSTEEANKFVDEKISCLNLIKTLGSDVHSADEDFYNRISFYKMTHNELFKIFTCALKKY